MKNILLFADIGGHECEQYYHIGDEAMFYETWLWYKKNRPNWNISAFTWFKPKETKIHFHQHLFWNQKPSWLYFLKLVTKLFFYKFTQRSLFSSKEYVFIKAIKDCHRIHFTGGGNITSNFRRWLYYCFFVLLTAKIFGKEIILTSQTIGPFSSIDKLFAAIFLNFPKLIGIRAKTNKKDLFIKYKIFYPKVVSMLDAAYTKINNNLAILSKKNKKPFIIGLSLHEWNNYTKETSRLVAELIKNIAITNNIKVILIPHHLVPNKENTDIIFMKNTMKLIPKKVKAPIIEYSEKLFKHKMPANSVKFLTSRVDFLITTRYHGLVFSLSQNVPTLALHLDNYYQDKNLGIIKMVYESNFEKYFANVKNKNEVNLSINKAIYLINNNENEKLKLKKINDNIFKKNTLNTVMNNLEKIS